jgi:hypothetical protein
MKMTFPTQGIVEDCLNKIFPGLPASSLSSSVTFIGNIPEHHNAPGAYGTLPVHVSQITGIDIPILLTNDDKEDKEVKGTVVIVAQDPLRSIKDPMLKPFIPFDKPIVGTPFAFHYELQYYKQTEVYRLIVDDLLKKGYNVYITDIWKCWDKDKTYRGRWEKGNPHFDCLVEEIDEIKPDYVILMGKQAQNNFDSIKCTQPTQICVPHPSAAANGAWVRQIGKCDIPTKADYIIDKFLKEAGNK